MTDLRKRNLLMEKLAAFGFSPLETEILAVLGEKTPQTIAEIQKKLMPSNYFGRYRLRKCLKKLHKDAWISITKGNPTRYSLALKPQLQKNLNAIITEAQITFQTQKKYYRSILKLFQNLSAPTSSIQSKISIPQSSPAFLRTFIDEVAKLQNLTLIKMEVNMVIALRKENVFFRLNSVEFEYQQDDHSYYCGVIFCMVDDPELLAQTISKIHQYNANGLKFSYKLESKGYSDRKARSPSEYSVDPSLSQEKDELLKSVITLLTPKKSYHGTIETIPLTNNPHYCVSIWKETDDTDPDLQSLVKVLQNLKENDTGLK